MARIQNYNLEDENDISLDDFLLGSDQITKATRNFPVGAIVDFVEANIANTVITREGNFFYTRNGDPTNPGVGGNIGEENDIWLNIQEFLPTTNAPDPTYLHLFIRSETGWMDEGINIIGQRGATGADGARGATGADGQRGPTGDGFGGLISTNLAGGAGVELQPQSEDSNGQRTNIGPAFQVLNGATGARGANGAAGSDGQRGLQGLTGGQGIMGDQGVQGRFEVDIFTRDNTQPGPVPPGSTFSTSGDLTNVPLPWFDNIADITSTGQLWESRTTFDPSNPTAPILWSTPFQAGAQGPTGRQGNPGSNGADGASFVGVDATRSPSGTATRIQPRTTAGNVGNPFDIPDGVDGNDGGIGPAGAAATVRVRDTNTLAAGMDAAVREAPGSTPTAAIFDFDIPAGATGAAGADGARGGIGPQGLRGPQGLIGPEGKTIRNGSGDPENAATGNDDDFYIDTDNNDIYGPKNGGGNTGWGPATSLIGPRGPQGIQGIQGIPGPGGAGIAPMLLVTASDTSPDSFTNIAESITISAVGMNLPVNTTLTDIVFTAAGSTVIPVAPNPGAPMAIPGGTAIVVQQLILEETYSVTATTDSPTVPTIVGSVVVTKNKAIPSNARLTSFLSSFDLSDFTYDGAFIEYGATGQLTDVTYRVDQNGWDISAGGPNPFVDPASFPINANDGRQLIHTFSFEAPNPGTDMLPHLRVHLET